MLDYQYMHHVEMNSATIIKIMAISIMTINCFVAGLINLTKCDSAMICCTLFCIRIRRFTLFRVYIYIFYGTYSVGLNGV